MIHKITSSLPSFKAIEFRAGLNIVLARKEPGASAKQTRNRAGKSSLIEIIHFLAGANVPSASIFRGTRLLRESFTLDFDVRGHRSAVTRSGKSPSQLIVNTEPVTNSEWLNRLGQQIFGLGPRAESAPARLPTFRSLFSYFVRRQSSGGFGSPAKNATQQQPGDYQVALMFLLGLDWEIASRWQLVRDRAKDLAALRSAAEAGVFGDVIADAADLSSQLTLAEADLRDLTRQLDTFRVADKYHDLEAAADLLSSQLAELANANVLDEARIRDLQLAISQEHSADMPDLERVYQEAGIALPGIALKRFEDVRNFHESVVRNRREYLRQELDSAQRRKAERDSEVAVLDAKRSEVMAFLGSHGALEQFHRLQIQAGARAGAVEALRRRLAAAVQLDRGKNEMEIERNQLELSMSRDLEEQRARVVEATLAFEAVSKVLYQSAGRMVINVTANGPEFKFIAQGALSKGISNMQIFCFDLMLMKICAERGIGPGFLVHDSHLFDGVDGRQVTSALQVGAEMASSLGFQYIVTMNEDDAYKELSPNFAIDDYLLPIQLTDAAEDGGLFGTRF